MTSPRLAVPVATALLLFLFLPVPPTAGGELALDHELPVCPAGAAPSAGAADPASPPPSLPSLDHPAACRAEPTRVEPVTGTGLPVPRPGSGYHHLGATTVGEWAGVLGRLAVVDPAIRPDSYDFVATRFMAKRGTEHGKVVWLEVGWAETGWSGAGRQRIYTFDSTAMSWRFFDDYRIGDRDQVWVYLHGGPADWRAWLWWDGRWRLLAAPDLPLAGPARVEQYVEVHQDRPGRRISVPPIQVDEVRVQTSPDGELARWRAEWVPTVAQAAGGGYCLAWQTRYDTWSAGDCDATVQE
ncbi:MAG TPA: hypothetical protein VIL54_10240 [Natronosporangium sp.]